MKLLDVDAGRTTQGHRFLGRPVTLGNAADYVAALKAQFVIVEPAARKQLISDQIHQIAADHQWQIDLDADLLEEVNNLAVSYTHLTLPTIHVECRSRWSPYH